jgi:hypothetical protein
VDFNRRDLLSVAAAAGGLSSLPAAAASKAAQRDYTDLGRVPPWFSREDIRISWNILRDIDGGRNGAELIEGAAAAGANLVCITVGGNRAFYPTRVPFHERSSTLAPGRDLVGEVASAAKARKLKLIARFDFSKQPATTMQAHPEWFYKNPNGSLSTNQGRYRPCLHGGFYRGVAPAIVAEVVERYRPAMLFLNNWSNYILQPGDSQVCHCDACTRAWAENHPGKPLPAGFSGDYFAFLKQQAAISGYAVEMPIRQKYPDIVIINSDYDPSDGVHLESRMVRPGVQMWPYLTTEATDRQFTSHPGKIGFNLCISYSHNQARLTVMPPAETRLHMFQTIASGSPPAYAMTGTFDQYDRQALGAAKEIFAWHKRNAEYYVGQQNAARVLLLCRPESILRHKEAGAETSERGLYQILAENHVPLTSSHTSAPMLREPGRYDLVIVARGAPLDGVESFVRNGGAAIFVDQHPGFAIPKPAETVKTKGTSYWRVRDGARLPGFPSMDFIQAGGSPADVENPTFELYPPEPDAILTYVPPMFEDPAEQAASNLRDTQTPGLLFREVGKGRIAFLPWDLGGIYNRIYMPAHAQLLMAVIRNLRPGSGEIETDAAATVQMVLMEQPQRRRKLVHLVNLSGQTQRGYSDPARIGSIKVGLRGTFQAVDSLVLGRSLPVTQSAGRTVVELPTLDLFDSLVFSA